MRPMNSTPRPKKWRKDMIEMSYDIEDYIDDFTSRVGEAGDDVGVLRKASHYLRTFKDRCRIASQIKKIKTLVIEASKRRNRYMLDQCIPCTTRVIVDPRLSALYQKSESLVGIDSKKEEIVRWVMDEGQQLKVMSIVGFGGLGKTTLANEVYREVGGKIDCKAIVSISQNPDILKLLNSLMLQLGLQPYSHACVTQDLINNIIKHLRDKRYFIIIDDLWDIQAWNIISCAFPQNNHYSRVMITTRIEKVARASCGRHLGFIHYMKPLSEQDSRKLFFDRICESEDDACPPDFVEVSCKVLKKCGGLPLAIITMASMIACQPTRSKGQWAEYIQNSLGAEFATNPTYENMMHIIDFSYKNLPRHLKACFLYLGTYPEDHKIRRVDLVRRWVAEGFVSCSDGQDVWDVAESYFSELVNRSMIQPECEDYGDIHVEVTHCRVHDMMLELILRKYEEDNFISLIHGPEMVLGGQYKLIRRLSIDLLRGADGGVTVMANTRHLSQVRSLNKFRGDCRIPNLAEFKFMRLLFLNISPPGMAIDLIGINHLSQLRYLKVVAGLYNKVLLPAQIRGMRLLETLDLSEVFSFTTHDDSCPLLQEIVDDVPRLSHVSLPHFGGERLPDGIGMAKSLVTLEGFSLVKSSEESITGLGKLTSLSELILNGFGRIQDLHMMPCLSTQQIAALITSLEKLDNLRAIKLARGDTVYSGDDMLGPSFSPRFRKIERLYLNLLIFSVVPRWIGHLCCLRMLVLRAKQIHQEDFNIIGTNLTSLLDLRLHISRVPTERIMIGGSTGFKVLKRFIFDCDGVSCLTFEVGAMPDLQRIELYIDSLNWDKATPVGLQQLPSLKTIRLYGIRESVFQEAADALPTCPRVCCGGSLSRPKEMMT